MAVSRIFSIMQPEEKAILDRLRRFKTRLNTLISELEKEQPDLERVRVKYGSLTLDFNSELRLNPDDFSENPSYSAFYLPAIRDTLRELKAEIPCPPHEILECAISAAGEMDYYILQLEGQSP